MSIVGNRGLSPSISNYPSTVESNVYRQRRPPSHFSCTFHFRSTCSRNCPTTWNQLHQGRIRRCTRPVHTGLDQERPECKGRTGTGCAADDAEGYQWKAFFLPPGTRLRTTCKGQRHHAKVVGDRIVFAGRDVTPSSFANAMSTAPRSAWRTIWLLFPDERAWRPAARCIAEAAKATSADR